MVPGDMPCNYTCETRRCPYNIDGTCADNATCDKQTKEVGAE